MSEKVTVEVDDIEWDGVEWSALHYANRIVEAAGLQFETSVQNWTPEGYRGIGFDYRGGKGRIAYLRDGNLARLTRNTTGVDVPEVVEVVEKG